MDNTGSLNSEYWGILNTFFCILRQTYEVDTTRNFYKCRWKMYRIKQWDGQQHKKTDEFLLIIGVAGKIQSQVELVFNIG